MAEGEVIVKTKVVADTAGAESTKAAVKEFGDQAKTSATVASTAFGAFSKAVSAAGRVVGSFTRALGLIGLAMNAVNLLIDGFQKVKEWLDKDRKAAEELARSIQDAKNKAAIEASAAAYAKLNTQLAEAVRLEQERDRNAAQRQSIERAAEDAQTELEMQRELAGLDRNDPDYAENAELVRSKYARLRAQRAADRASRDLNARQMGLYAKADANEERAGAYEKDVYGKTGDAVISIKNQLAREKAPERRKDLEAQLDRLLAEQKKKLDKIKELRDEAESLRKEAASLMGGDTAAIINAKAVGVAQDAADADTVRRRDANRAARAEAERQAAEKKAAEVAQRAADEKTVAEGTAKMAELGSAASSEEARAEAAADAYAKEGADVVAAQGRYDMLVANGGSRRERSAALAALQQEQREAEEAKLEMERTAAQVATTLKGIKEQINALSRAVKQAQSRLSNSQADAPEG